MTRNQKNTEQKPRLGHAVLACQALASLLNLQGIDLRLECLRRKSGLI